MRDSFIFYRSFYEAIKNLPRDIQGEIYTAIMEYSLYGNETENLKPVARSIFTLIKPQIDVNNKRFNNGCKGGRPKGDSQTKTKEKPKQNQTKTKEKPNDNVNDNDIKEISLERDKEKPDSAKLYPPEEIGRLLAEDAGWLQFQPENIYRQAKATVSEDKVLEFIGDYVCKLKAEGVNYKSLEDAKIHFANWIVKLIKSEGNGNSRSGYTSKQEANQYAAEMLARHGQELASGMEEQVERPF